jgi:hypothetical protein
LAARLEQPIPLTTPQEGRGHDAYAAARAPDMGQPLGMYEFFDL